MYNSKHFSGLIPLTPLQGEGEEEGREKVWEGRGWVGGRGHPIWQMELIDW